MAPTIRFSGITHINPSAHSSRSPLPHPQGGQHRSPAGITSLDSLSHPELVEDHRQRLADFEAALELAKFGTLSGREW